MRMACMINDLLMLDDDQFTVCGLINIIDMVGASKSLAYIGQFTPQVVKSVSYATQDALPVRTKGIHFLNPPPTFDTVFGFFKGMFNKKNASRADKGLVVSTWITTSLTYDKDFILLARVSRHRSGVTL